MTSGSLSKLKECHPNLQTLIEVVDKIYPVQVICGYRNEADQNKAFKEKKSKLKYPLSKHNKRPSYAVDIVPDPDRNPKTIEWNDIDEFKKMLSVVEAEAAKLRIKIRLGRDFKFKDFPHVELI